MKISYNWLKEYLNIDNKPETVAEILTNTGLEVEGLEKYSQIEGGLEGLVVGEIVEKTPHPNADKLALTKVNIGTEEFLPIVCGAPNVSVGQKVIVATVGTTLYPAPYESFKIKKAKIRGEVSMGMICAEDEIGVGKSHEGIMVLPPHTKIGISAAKALNLPNDYIFEIGLTPNRSDAMGHIGVARDIAAAINVKNEKRIGLKTPQIKSAANSQESKHISVKVEDKNACPRYSGIVLSNIKVAASPEWLQNRLLSIGLKPINNVVDVTNFVLKEYGQPLHAFDYNKIEGQKIVVRKALKNENFTTLDDVQRKLDEEDLVIASESKPMCLAGVFGGIDSGVTENTTSIFLESAYFDSTCIRKTSTRYNLRTDAATRYEKGADPNITLDALNRAVSLLGEVSGALIASDIIDIYPNKLEPFSVKLNLKRLNKMAGIKIETSQVKSILHSLDILVKSENEELLYLEVPRYRADVTREADVMEEVLRIFGFNNIPIPSKVKSTLVFTNGFDKYLIENNISDILNGAGFYEIMTNSISKSKFYNENEVLVTLENSMTTELDIMRSSLLPSGLEVLAHNINRKNSDLKFYEFGHIYLSDYSQQKQLALFATGTSNQPNWNTEKENVDFYFLKGKVEALLARLNIVNYLEEAIENDKELEYGIQLSKNGKILAKIGKIEETQATSFDIKQPVFYANLEWDYIIKLKRKQKVKFEQITKYPSVERDLAIIVEENIPFEEIKVTIEKAGGKLLQNVQLFDVFRSEEKIGKGKKSYAVSFTLLNSEKTLTDIEIEAIFNKIMRSLEEKCNAIIRK